MSLGVILGSITALLMGIFLGIVVWTYGIKRAADFEAMARLPLEDKEGRL
jgi:cbb3-type cytochrome oxidase subunit 3